MENAGPWTQRHPWIALVIVALGVLPAVVYVAGESCCRSFDPQRFVDLHGQLMLSEEMPLEAVEGHQILEVTLEDHAGLTVTGHLKTPLDGEPPYPALLLLGGARTGRHTLDYLPSTRGVVLLALDYPYEGKRSGLGVIEFLTAIPEIRRAIIRTVPASMLAVDYLLSRQEVDPDQIALVAGSLGALFAPAVGATDHRFAAVVLLFGGGDVQSLLETNIRDDLGLLTRPAAWLGKILTCPVEPLDHIGGIAPRPLLMLNGNEDLGIPEHNTRLLFNAAREPKALRWIDAGHLNIRDERFHRLVTQELVTWFVEQGFTVPDSVVELEKDPPSPPNQVNHLTNGRPTAVVCSAR
jgi:dienelactone hydrolase